MVRGKPLGWWLIRVVGAVFVPVSCVAVAAGLVWITEHGRHFWLYVLVLLLAIPFLANLGLAPTWLWMDILDRRAPGCLFSAVHLVAASVACGLTFFSYELWVLEWWGVETACTLLDVQERSEVRDVNGSVRTFTYYDAALRCADPDAPEVMTTETPVSGDRITVYYDPAGSIETRPMVEVEASRDRATIAAAAGVVWAVLLFGLMAFTPEVGEPDAEPSTSDDS
jgi:hypothetical protein